MLNQSLMPSIWDKENRSELLRDENQITTISLYNGDVAEKSEVITEVKKLVAAFPDITNDYIIVLVDRMVQNGFTKKRVTDAVNHVIDNYEYKRPPIAKIISFDKKMRVYTYSEIVAKCNTSYRAFEHYDRMLINDQWVYFEKQ